MTFTVTAHGVTRDVSDLELARVALMNAGFTHATMPHDIWIQSCLDRGATAKEIVYAAMAGLRVRA